MTERKHANERKRVREWDVGRDRDRREGERESEKGGVIEVGWEGERETEEKKDGNVMSKGGR